MNSFSDWHAALKLYSKDLRNTSPLPDRESLTLEEEEQCRIIGGALIGWLENNGPYMLEQRKEMAEYAEQEEPLIVLLTTAPGLLAAEDIAGSDQDRLFFFTPDQWADFAEQHPDDEMHFHVINTSSVRPTEADDELPPNAPGTGALWLHEEATRISPQIMMGAHHLWHYDGERAQLIQEALRRVEVL
jgi:hypothetical protein